MIGGDDLAQMRANLLEVRDDRTASIVFRRGETTLAAQSVRIARTGGVGQRSDSAGGQESRGQVVILGATSLDIQPGDRFTEGGRLYRVILVRPNRSVMTAAEAELVE